jgi:hypothetical protein
MLTSLASGNSVYDNPYCISDDSGRPMDYIGAIRVNLEMLAGEMGPLHEAIIEAEQKWDVETDPLF